MMDSFYDLPRDAPIPVRADQPASPLVPDVSLLFQNKMTNSTQDKLPQFNDACPSYNVWKSRKSNKENETNTSFNFGNGQSFSRKQVRFEGPTVENTAKVFESCEKTMATKTDPDISTTQNQRFEQIYMANVPNRHLDLSIIEPSKPIYSSLRHKNQEKNVEVIPDGTNSQFLTDLSNMQSRKVSDNSDHSILRYCRSRNMQTENIIDKSKMYPTNPRNYSCDRNTYTQNQSGSPTAGLRPSNNNAEIFQRLRSNNLENYAAASVKPPEIKTNNDSDPTVKDLLKIIQQQNEQLILLQKQVASLLQNKSNQKQIEPASTNNCITSTQIEPVNLFNKNISDKQNSAALPSKIAIDVMTSFEVSIRNIPHRGKKDLNHEPKIQEITETDSNVFDKDRCFNVLDGIRNKEHCETVRTNNIDDTLTLSESLKIQQESPSPENSIHVDMQDFSSDSDDDSVVSGDIGWTIYNNVMGQVNNILKKTRPEINKDEINGLHLKAASEKVKDKTMQRVKEATLRHLKSIGVSLPKASDDSITETTDSNGPEYTPSEISFAVKQLLMKYMPDEQLAKVTYQQTNNNNHVGNYDDANALIKGRPEFSFATLQYMKKYNLLNVDNDVQPQQETKRQIITKANPKILDITALKQQPKLL